MEVFEFKGKFYIIPRLKYEVREIYIERVWYILNNLKEKDINKDILLKSILWSNEKNLKCKYDN